MTLMTESTPAPASIHTERVGRLLPHLQSRVLGQETAVEHFAATIRPGELGLTRKGEPRSFALLSGPTGTGKTKIILEASAYLYPGAHVARIDMAEFSSPSSIPRLIGEGAGDAGLLGEQIRLLRETGGHFLLIDEIEKGAKQASDLFLGMEAARITLGTKETIDLSDFHILVTTNLGAADLAEAGDAIPARTIRRVVEQAAKTHFRPEVLGRFDALIVYRKLTHATQVAICRQMLSEELEHLSRKLSQMLGNTHVVEAAPAVFPRLVIEGYHRELGARPMRGTIKRRLRNAVAVAMTEGRLVKGFARSVLEVAEGNDLHLTIPRQVMRLSKM
jgi:ATP-dependent Clp protease ATP-binding subunit ClpA